MVKSGATKAKNDVARYSNYELLYSEEVEPEILIFDQTTLVNLVDVCRSADKNQSMIAMEEEMTSLKTNKTWDLVLLPHNRKALTNCWVYKLKEDDGGRKRYHARLVVKGYAWKKGLNLDEISSPFVWMTTVQIVLGLVAIWDLELEQLDVKTTFLDGDIDEELYMQQLKGYVQKGK